MLELLELLERATIRFDSPFTLEGLEKELFPYLEKIVPCDVSYVSNSRREVHHDNGDSKERNIFEFTGTIKKLHDSDSLSTINFEAVHIPVKGTPAIFTGIRINGVLGYTSLEELESLPAGRDQLIFFDDVRRYVESYFRQSNL